MDSGYFVSEYSQGLISTISLISISLVLALDGRHQKSIRQETSRGDNF
jgi:hypothetical protein